MRPVLFRLLGLSLVAFVATACGKINIPASLNVDDTAPATTVTIQTPGGAVQWAAEGGIDGDLVIDTSHLLSPQGILAMVAGNAEHLVGTADSGNPFGTLCVKFNPDDPTSGTVYLNVFTGSKANLHFSGISLLPALVPLGLGPVNITADASNVPLQINWSKLLTFNLNGAIKASAVAMGQVPAGTPVLGGEAFTLAGNLTSATQPYDLSTVPATQDCTNAGFF